MLGERCFRFINYFGCSVVLYKIMSGDDCDFLDVRIGGRSEHPFYYSNYPCQKIPAYLDNFYLYKLTYYFYELV